MGIPKKEMGGVLGRGMGDGGWGRVGIERICEGSLTDDVDEFQSKSVADSVPLVGTE